MACQPHPGIHPTAIISPEADLQPDVRIGPYTVIDGAVTLGAGCVVGPHVHLIGPITAGSNNAFHTGCVMGDKPQHLKYANEPTRVEIGNGNVFREHVTIHRGTTHSWATRIGSNNFLMANAHIGHDSRLGDQCILANGALLGGHCVIGDNVILSGNCALHQFTRVGRLALLSGVSACTKDLPPFTVMADRNTLVGVNVIGMRRSGMSNSDIDAVKRAYQAIFRDGGLIREALIRVEMQLGDSKPVRELVDFIRASTRGVPTHERGQHESKAA